MTGHVGQTSGDPTRSLGYSDGTHPLRVPPTIGDSAKIAQIIRIPRLHGSDRRWGRSHTTVMRYEWGTFGTEKKAGMWNM